MSVVHAFSSGKSDGGDATLVRPSNWNADHTVTTITSAQDAQTPITLTRFYQNFVCSYNGYVQIALQNKSNGTGSSSDFVATTDTGTDTTEYIDMGINGSGFTGDWGGAKDGYLYVDGGATGVGDLNIGTARPETYIDFLVGGAAVANRKMQISETHVKCDVPLIGNYGTSLMMHAGMFMQ